MPFYHMSQTLSLGDSLTPDWDGKAELCQPFIQALERSEDCFYAMVLNGKYLYAVLGKFRLWEWSNYAKWATEGAFELIRQREFPHRPSRLNSNYFYDDLNACRELFRYDWGSESEEEQQKVHLYRMELADPAPARLDMTIYDQAYDAMRSAQDVSAVLSCARRYFAGECSDRPIWELLSESSAKAVEDITLELK